MKRIVFAALAAVALVCPRAAFAQALQTTYGASPQITYGTLVSLNDTVAARLYGTQWATARIQVTTAGTATVTFQVSTDGGTNWFASPYARRLDAVSANPTISLFSNTTPTVAAYEVPLGGNVTDVRVLCGTGGTSTLLNISGAVPYVPGVPVVAVLYDVTEGSIGAGLTTGNVDVSGWASVQAELATPTTQVWTLRLVDDAGSVYGAPFTTTAVTSSRIVMSVGSAAGGPGPLASGVGGVWPFIDRRINLNLPAGGTVSTGRARLVARR